MLEIQTSHKADSDLEDIWHYSFQQWGEEQADRYYDKLDAAINQLGHMPKIGKPREQIRLGLRAYHTGRHIIYYQIYPTYIYILRVRHDQSDPYLYED